MSFKQLHQQDKALLICNVWDVSSAQIAEQLNFQAIGTSSAAIAATQGYDDGEHMAFSDLLSVVHKISSNTTLPLTVDIESGYSSHPQQILEHIHQLSNLGVVGINVEDSVVNNKRRLMKAEAFAETLTIIKKQLIQNRTDVFINVRTDGFLLQPHNAIVETQKRIKIYQTAGADGIFVPGIEKINDIRTITSYTTLPINVMCMPKLASFSELNAVGVKRISMGNFLFNHQNTLLQNRLKNIIEQQSFASIFH